MQVAATINVMRSGGAILGRVESMMRSITIALTKDVAKNMNENKSATIEGE